MADERVVVVTGAAKGIGHAVARRFQREGWQVLGLDVEASGEAPFELVACDVSKEEMVRDAITRAVDSYGHLDALVNSAGIIVVGPVEEMDWQDFERLFAVNMGGTWLTCKYALPIMKRQKGGVIINVASVSGHVGQVDHALYGATKGAIIAFTRALALEAAPYGIRALSVSPGSIDTDMLRGDVARESERLGVDYEELCKEREREQALQRWADPSEVAGPVYFLATQDASFMTGTDVLVDAGWTAR